MLLEAAVADGLVGSSAQTDGHASWTEEEEEVMGWSGAERSTVSQLTGGGRCCVASSSPPFSARGGEGGEAGACGASSQAIAGVEGLTPWMMRPTWYR